YRGGITLDNTKYQDTPSKPKAYAYVRKIQEIDKRKIIYKTKKQVDPSGVPLTDKSGKELFQKIYKPTYQLDQTDLDKLKAKI
ncbi:transcriptional regulator, partial [Streptococcus suis]